MSKACVSEGKLMVLIHLERPADLIIVPAGGFVDETCDIKRIFRLGHIRISQHHTTA